MSDKDLQRQVVNLEKQISDIKNSLRFKSSPARLRAERKYYSTITPLSLRFKKIDKELWECVDAQKNKNEYIKSLIAHDLGYKDYQDFLDKNSNLDATPKRDITKNAQVAVHMCNQNKDIRRKKI